VQLRHSFILFLSIAIIFSCKKEGVETISVEGVITDDASKQPLSGVLMSIDAIKSPSGMGIITDGKRETVGRTTTDANGYYKVKLKVFNEAQHLEFYLNPGKLKKGYVDRQQDIYLSDLNGAGSNRVDFTLSPTALLKIKFRNTNPVSDTDFFYFGWNANGNGGTKGIVQIETCGTVAVSEALTWTGKDVCGTFTVETIAEQNSHVYWTVKKGGVTKQYSDSVFVKRDIVNEFSVNY
jgi:hypothetical protein